VALVNAGKGIMPRFGAKDEKPGILADEDIAKVSAFVWEKANSGW